MLASWLISTLRSGGPSGLGEHHAGLLAGGGVGLACGCLDDEVESSVVGESLVELEGEGVAAGYDRSLGRSLRSGELGRVAGD